MNAKHVVQVFKSAFIHKPPKTPLGRWTIHDNLLHTKLKIKVKVKQIPTEDQELSEKSIQSIIAFTSI